MYSASSAAFLLLAFVLANVPFFTDRFLGAVRLSRPKSLVLRLLECLIYYGMAGAVGIWLEQRQGQVAPQGWEFYAITAALFLTFAFPGFVYRFLVRRGA